LAPHPRRRLLVWIVPQTIQVQLGERAGRAVRREERGRRACRKGGCWKRRWRPDWVWMVSRLLRSRRSSGRCVPCGSMIRKTVGPGHTAARPRQR
jgi:hypothetical protein